MENQPVSSTPEQSESGLWKWLIAAAIVIILAGAGWYFYAYYNRSTVPDNSDNIKGDILKPKTVSAQGFSEYKDVKVNVSPKVADYKVNADLSNVKVNSNLEYQVEGLSEEGKKMLASNAFVVTPNSYNEFFSLYESNRYQMIPNFVTTDSILHTYHLYFDHLLRQLEEQYLIPELKKLNAGMLAEAKANYDLLKGTSWEVAAKRNVGFFSVGSILMDPTMQPDALVKSEVEQELGSIAEHGGIAASAVMNIGTDAYPLSQLMEDYSQYIPRGHYDKSDALKAYFKSMMWYGRINFKFDDNNAIKSSVLITKALEKGANKASWDKIYEPTVFFVGKSDDVTFYQVADLLEQIYGPSADLKAITSDDQKFATLRDSLKQFEPPKVNSMPVFDARFQPDRNSVILGFRFMGQRYTLDADIFQRLIYREVGDTKMTCDQYDAKKTSCQSGARCLPKALDIVAAMGSDKALEILASQDETKYACYSENMTKMKSYIFDLKKDIWTQNLYWGWLYSLKPLAEVKGKGYPVFMTNSAWAAKDLNTYTGSWTELKHDTILYAKQVYAELGGGADEPVKEDDRGYVEPNVEVYARLAGLLDMTRTGLSNRGIISDGMKDGLDKMIILATSLKDISEKELNESKLSDADYELIRSYGGQLEHFWFDVNKDDMKDMSQMAYLNENPAAIVADVATDPNGSVLEEGTGPIYNIFVVVPVDGKLRLAKGGIYSHFEFKWPMSDRLTDTKWRELMNSDKAPKLSEWTKAFIAQ